MAYDENTASRIRDALAQLPAVEEKRMFGGLAFMVNGKMCISVTAERIMCRIDPAFHEEALAKKGASTVIMNKKEYRGYVHVKLEAIHSQNDLDRWVHLALDFNKKAKPSRTNNISKK